MRDRRKQRVLLAFGTGNSSFLMETHLFLNFQGQRWLQPLPAAQPRRLARRHSAPVAIRAIQLHRSSSITS